MKICSAEFDDTPGDRAALLRAAHDLLIAGRQFTAMPRFDVDAAGPHSTTGWTLSWPAAPLKAA